MRVVDVSEQSDQPGFVVLPGGVEGVRRLEKFFFGERGFSAERAVDFLVKEAAVRKASVKVVNLDGWWVLSAEQDWLPSDNDGLDAFYALLPFPECGPNAAHLEAILTAFARTVVTASHGTIAVIVEDSDTNVWVAAHEAKLRRSARVIAFDT
jgi:hypothetical protein